MSHYWVVIYWSISSEGLINKVETKRRALGRFLNQSRAALVLAVREMGLFRAPRWALQPLVLRVAQQAWR